MLVDLDDIPMPDADERAALMVEALGATVLSEFAAGTHGRCFMLDDGLILKVSDVRAEAVMAAFLLERPSPLFPAIRAVHKLSDAFGAYFGIVRENADDFFDDPTEFEKECDEEAYHVWKCVRHGLRPDTFPEQFINAMGLIPGLVDRMISFHADLTDYFVHSGIEVSDLIYSNIGLTQDKRIVVRDFGENSIMKTTVGLQFEASIIEPEPVLGMTMSTYG